MSITGEAKKCEYKLMQSVTIQKRYKQSFSMQEKHADNDVINDMFAILTNRYSPIFLVFSQKSKQAKRS